MVDVLADGLGRREVKTDAFSKNMRPEETFDDGVAVTELLMAAYKSAEIDAAVELEGASLDAFVPAVARGTWNPRAKKH